MGGIILAGLFGLVMALFVIAVLIVFILQIAGTVINFLFWVGIIWMGGVAALIGLYLLWKLSKRAWRDGSEMRRWFKKNKEIKNRMKHQATHR